jgi:hypothetical protein
LSSPKVTLAVGGERVVVGEMRVELRDDAEDLVAFFFGHGASLTAEDDLRAHAVAQLVVVD